MIKLQLACICLLTVAIVLCLAGLLTVWLLPIYLPCLAWNVFFASVSLRKWAIGGTIKVGTHDPANPLCACGTCEAYGRWLKRPLPIVDLALPNDWLDVVADDSTAAERDLIQRYVLTPLRTPDFLEQWDAKQSAVAAPEIPARPVGHISGGSPEANRERIRCAIEHYYRSRSWEMPSLVVRRRMADSLLDLRIHAIWCYNGKTGEGNYRFDIEPDRRMMQHLRDNAQGHQDIEEKIMRTQMIPSAMILPEGIEVRTFG